MSEMTVSEWESGEREPRPNRQQRANETRENLGAMGLERMLIVCKSTLDHREEETSLQRRK